MLDQELRLVLQERAFEKAVEVAEVIYPVSEDYHRERLAKVEIEESSKESAFAGTGSKSRIWMNLLVCNTEERYWDTLIHEWAHVLVFKYIPGGRGHDKNWKRVALLMGDTGDRCHDYPLSEVMPHKYFRTTCANGHVFELSKRMVNTMVRGARRFCNQKHRGGKCGRNIAIPEQFQKAALSHRKETVLDSPDVGPKPHGSYTIPAHCNHCDYKTFISKRKFNNMTKRGIRYQHKQCGGQIVPTEDKK